MASYDMTRTVVDGRPIANRFSTLISNISGSFAAWNDARQTRRALSKLSDHELDDLGLTRSDIANMTGRLSHL